MSAPLSGRTPTAPDERPRSALANLRRLGRLLLQCPGRFWLTLGCAIAASLSLVLAPWMIGRIIDRHALLRDTSALLADCLALLAVYGLAALFAWAQAHVMAGVAQRSVRHLRGQLFGHLQRLPLDFFARHSQGELMSRATHDLELLGTTLNQGAIQLLSSLVLVAGALGLMLALSPLLTLISVLSLAAMLLATRCIAARSRRAFARQQAQLGTLNGQLQESLAGQPTLRLFAAQARSAAQVEGSAQALRRSAWHAQILAGAMGPAMNTCNNLGFALITAVGGWLALQGSISIGVVVAFLGYARQLERPVNELANQFNLMQAAMAGVERGFAILDQPDEFVDERPVALPRLRGEIRFEGVAFEYTPGRPILRGIDLSIAAGQCVALVGATGAGKSTLFNLLLRFIEPGAGRILIDGLALNELPRQALRRQIGVVLQDCHLFDSSLRANLRYGRPGASDEEVERIAQLTGADDFIRDLPDGYESRLGGSGVVLSQGQRQLLAITRALLLDPAILLLDEATSNLDARSEAQVQRALGVLLEGRTSLVIAHRLHTIRQADRVLLLEQGRLMACGGLQSGACGLARGQPGGP